MCGRSTGTYTNLGDLQRDLRGLSPTPPNKKKLIPPAAVHNDASRTFSTCGEAGKVREQSGNREFWKHDVIPAYIKVETQTEAVKLSNQANS
jgi:hypothetical protein